MCSPKNWRSCLVLAPQAQGAFYLMTKLPVDSAERFCSVARRFSHNGETVMLAPGPGFTKRPAPVKAKSASRPSSVNSRCDEPSIFWDGHWSPIQAGPRHRSHDRSGSVPASAAGADQPFSTSSICRLSSGATSLAALCLYYKLHAPGGFPEMARQRVRRHSVCPRLLRPWDAELYLGTALATDCDAGARTICVAKPVR